MMVDAKKEAERLVVRLFEIKEIDENMMFHVTGKKVNDKGKIINITGTQAKYFKNMETGYVYPLFKTHKYKDEEIAKLNIMEIKTRLVQSAGNTFLHKVTAFLEYIMKPISTKYCNSIVNEYCQDSKHYLDELMQWKYEESGNDDDNYLITAVDVVGLYPNIEMNLVVLAVEDALETCSGFSEEGREILMALIQFCLENTFVQFGDKFYRQQKGIVTGENNSVSLANISMHFIIKHIPEINTKTIIFKRFIDDIIYISKNEEDRTFINEELVKKFKRFGLELTFRMMDTKEENGKVEFLDVWHCSNKDGRKNFITRDFVKPTAVEAKFLNGNSFHPIHVFKGIIFGEGKRLRRLNEKDNDYVNSIERLKVKCKRSGFKNFIIEEAFAVIKEYRNLWRDNGIQNMDRTNCTKDKMDKITWATNFKSLINLTKKEKLLVPKAQLTYCRPPTLSNKLINYRKIAKDENEVRKEGTSRCGSCGLCGNYGNLKGMVMECNQVKDKNGRMERIRQSLNCKDYGIYAANCKICEDVYVGQTCDRFSKRWSTHRSTWNGLVNGRLQFDGEDGLKNDGDKGALYAHYWIKHKDKLLKTKQFNIADAYTVKFLEKPSRNRLNVAENFWIGKLNAKINMAKTFLPLYK